MKMKFFKYMIANLKEYNAKYDKKLVKQTARNIIHVFIVQCERNEILKY